MRLLLDGHYSPEIARQLRERGHDVIAVAERHDLIGLSDHELFRRVVAEGRAIMTNNVKDFMPLSAQASVEGEKHFGLLLTSDRSLPRSRDAVGRVVGALAAFLQRHPGDDRLAGQIRWIAPVRT